MTERWRPMGTDHANDNNLYEGVPPWIEGPLWDWISDCLIPPGGRGLDFGVLRDFELATRARYPLAADAAQRGIGVLRRSWGDDQVLAFVDYLIYRNARPEGWAELNDTLEQLLADGGSSWRVGRRGAHAGLEQRVPAGVTEVAEAAMGASGDAGERLSAAWSALYGRQPNYSRAYSLAVKAVEDAVLKVVIPEDPTGTLGKAIATMRQQGDWGLSVPREHADHPSGAVVIGMMQTLWSGQVDRHGGNGSEEPDRASAEVAVGLATTLVLWFHSGVVHR